MMSIGIAAGIVVVVLAVIVLIVLVMRRNRQQEREIVRGAARVGDVENQADLPDDGSKRDSGAYSRLAKDHEVDPDAAVRRT